MTAKAEIANYSIATRFAKGKRIYHDKKFARPSSREDSIRQIEDTFRHNG